MVNMDKDKQDILRLFLQWTSKFEITCEQKVSKIYKFSKITKKKRLALASLSQCIEHSL